jgi:hypothetical protein
MLLSKARDFFGKLGPYLSKAMQPAFRRIVLYQIARDERQQIRPSGVALRAVE